MHRTAHITFTGGGLILPAHTPYDRQIIFEHVEAAAKHHELLGLRANGHYWSISHNTARLELCAPCSRGVHALAYRSNGQNFCGRCVRRTVT